MSPWVDWFGLALAGIIFTALGGFTLYGLRHGMVGGRDKPALERLCGT